MPLTLTRTIVGILIPGVIALSPWAIWTMMSFPSLAANYDKLTTLFSAVLTGAAIVVGATIEGLASQVETHWDGRREAMGQYKVMDDWYWYLSQTLEAEPVGYKYLSRTVTTLYFELGMMFSIPVASLGFLVMIMAYEPAAPRWYLALPIMLAAALAIFYRRQAYKTHYLLCETRKQLRARFIPAARLEPQSS